MGTSPDLWIASPAIPAPHHPLLKRLMTAVVNVTFDATEALQHVVRSRGTGRHVRRDLPWNVGLDHLGETGYPPFVPRGN